MILSADFLFHFFAYYKHGIRCFYLLFSSWVSTVNMSLDVKGGYSVFFKDADVIEVSYSVFTLEFGCLYKSLQCFYSK